tara:strand:- start:9241 stop:10611 length:1371 start_codon:yes stop_codon:yes gene_type:complete
MNQQTINKSVSFSGVGLHKGEKVTMKLNPSSENFGIIFKRVDLDNKIEIKADVNHVVSTKRGTTIGKNGVRIHTIEHILSALHALGIDNLLIEIDSSEVPIMDGSSKEFINEILNVGLKELDSKKDFFIIDEEFEYYDKSSGGYIKIIPYDGFKISFDIDFNIDSIGKQSFEMNSLDDYIQNVANCRTFCTYEEIYKLKSANLALGGSLDNALIFSDNNITHQDLEKINQLDDIKISDSVSENNFTLGNKKLHFDNEPVRHKVLDLIGDLYLLGKNIKGHVVSYKGGHELNVKILKKIINSNSNQDNFKFDKEQIENIIPHRDPFLLIDEIIDGRDGQYVVALKNITENEYYFKGHFPGEPIVPGVLLIETMAQTSCFLDMKNADNRNSKLMLLSNIKSARFYHTVVPGDKMYIRTDLIKYKLGTARVKGVITVNDNIVAEAEWMATMVKRKNENS